MLWERLSLYETPVTHRVTISWNIEDDQGRKHTIILPNSYYAPTGERLLSPQHWAQMTKDDYPIQHGTCCITTGSCIQLMWNQRKHIKTIPLDPKSNIGIMRTTPGYTKFNAFCSDISECDDEIALTSHLILDDEGQICNNGIHDLDHTPVCIPTADTPSWQGQQRLHVIPNDEAVTQREETTMIQNELEHKSQREEFIVLDGINSIPETAEPVNISDQGLLLRWHVRLGNISFKRLKILALQGFFPRNRLGWDPNMSSMQIW